MSYILDALKKAEHDRTQQHSINTHTLFSSKSENINTAVSHKTILYTGIAIMNALLVVGLFLFYTQPNEVDILSSSNQTKAVEMVEEKPMPLVSTIKNSASPITEENQHIAESKQEINKDKGAPPSSIVSLKQHTQLKPPPAISLPISPIVKENKLYFFNELPSNIQNILPKLEINVHVYSAVPKQRFVLLNGKQYMEGMPIAKDLRVKEIQPDTVIFQYKSYKFKLLRP